ncbi:MAG: EAL domain-containing protein [Pseudanabaenales cyanobacterium]|nr:EAL domain-containing protein [Pseudanabaenales cyanobacterium]
MEACSTRKKNIFHILLIEEGEDKKKVELKESVYTFGRDSANSIVLNSRGVSRKHAVVYRVREAKSDSYIFRIFDGSESGERSTNGLLINGKRCFSHDLLHGDCIVFCKGTCVRYFAFEDTFYFNGSQLNEIRNQPDSLPSARLDLDNINNQARNNKAEIDASVYSRAFSVLESLPIPLIEVSLDGTITYCNLSISQQFPDLLNQKLQHPILSGLISKFQHANINRFIREIKIGNKVFEQIIFFVQNLKVLRSYIVDITDKKKIEAELNKCEAKNKVLLDAIPDLIMQLNANGSILNFKDSQDSLLSLAPEMCIHKHISEILPAKFTQKILHSLRQTLQYDESQVFDCQLTGNSKVLYCEIRIVKSGDNEALIIMRNISDRKSFENQLRHDALHDSLTHLPNRNLFMERITHAIELSKRNKSYQFAVLFVDLDHFKVINDSLGHIIGDQLLVTIARKLSACIRAVDLVARLGGDEFAVLLEDIRGIERATEVAERIQRELSLPIYLDKHEIFTSASIGIASSELGYNQPEEILRDADNAMYHAKSLGRARYALFDSTMHARMVGLLKLGSDLHRAFERQEFQLHYQPIVSLKTNALVGFEALIRWLHPQQGSISPDQFIHLAEENGLIYPIGDWTFYEACHQLYQWQQRFPSAASLEMSINLSGKQFTHPQLVKQIEHTLNQIRLNPNNLKLEITESIVMEDSQRSKEMLLKLKALGLQLCIDDFGTGYSSLSYLHRFPVDTLKIDRSFVSAINMDDENTGIAITQSVTALAHTLGINVVAEGIETAMQLNLVRAFRCDYAQGYYFSKPLSHEQVEVLLANPTTW